MQEKHDLPADETQLRVENELKKLNLEMEYGAMFGSMPTSSGAPELPLEVESQWLDYISAFESQYKDVTEITVFSFLGQPEFKSFGELKTEEVEPALDRLFDIMEENAVHLDFLADYPIETVYRFVTEEFMEQPLSNMRIPMRFNLLTKFNVTKFGMIPFLVRSSLSSFKVRSLRYGIGAQNAFWQI